MMFVKEQLNLFYIALGFFTRIPVPEHVDYNQNKLNHASRYFALVGWLVGLICGLVYWLAAQQFPVAIAILFSMLIGVFLTGCFHEDGLADTCDGLGGGWSVQQKLSIMKDSQIGTYGAVSVWFALTLKFALLLHLDNAWLALLVAHPVSRAVSTSLIYFLPYVTDDSNAKSKPLAKLVNLRDMQINLAIGCTALLLVPNHLVVLIVTLLVSSCILGYWFKRQINGLTGDTLGATQQVSELLIYLVLMVG